MKKSEFKLNFLKHNVTFPRISKSNQHITDMKNLKMNVQMTENELLAMLDAWTRGTTTASVSYESTPKINKYGKETYGSLTKVAKIGCIIGYDYENSVNNQREREEMLRDFMSASLWGGNGERVTPATSRHKVSGKRYLTYKWQQTHEQSYFDADGNVVSSEDAKLCFYAKKPNASQGVDKVVNHREMALATIKEIGMDNKVIEITR